MISLHENLPGLLYIAHRGLSSRYPENTLAAFRAAIDAGAGMLELDVTLTRDRRLAVIHDSTVNRTTNGRGRVNTMTMAHLHRLDAGGWFAERFAGEPVPSLEQVLDAVRGQVLLNIEIKPEAFEPRAPHDAVERQIVEMVTERQMTTDVLVSSFAWRVLARVRALSANLAIGLLSELPADERLIYWFRRLDGFSWHPDYRVVSRSQVKLLQGFGARVYPYTVGGRIDTAALLAMGVDGLIVDDPRQMAA
jgi:glycerophosphoryl diester phosphodiesterase